MITIIAALCRQVAEDPAGWTPGTAPCGSGARGRSRSRAASLDVERLWLPWQPQTFKIQHRVALRRPSAGGVARTIWCGVVHRPEDRVTGTIRTEVVIDDG